MTTVTISGSFSATETASSRVEKVFSCVGVTTSVAEVLMPLTASSNAVLSGSGTSFQVTDGKTLTLQSLVLNWQDSAGGSFCVARLRVTGSNQALDATGSLCLMSMLAPNYNQNSGNASACTVVTWPLGLQIPSGNVFGVSATDFASGRTVDVTLTGFEQ